MCRRNDSIQWLYPWSIASIIWVNKRNIQWPPMWLVTLVSPLRLFGSLIILKIKSINVCLLLFKLYIRKYMHAETLALPKHYIFWIWRIESICHGNTIILRIVLKLKNHPKISLLIRKLSISQTYIC
jgi:hypothetical protein